jgi:hypothetical protein
MINIYIYIYIYKEKLKIYIYIQLVQKNIKKLQRFSGKTDCMKVTDLMPSNTHRQI